MIMAICLGSFSMSMPVEYSVRQKHTASKYNIMHYADKSTRSDREISIPVERQAASVNLTRVSTGAQQVSHHGYGDEEGLKKRVPRVASALRLIPQ